MLSVFPLELCQNNIVFYTVHAVIVPTFVSRRTYRKDQIEVLCRCPGGWQVRTRGAGYGLRYGLSSQNPNPSHRIPRLRAELESDLKKICLGQKQKEVVLEEQIRKYREVFVQTCGQIHQLDQALSRFFGDPLELPDDPVSAQITQSQPVFSCPSRQAQMCVKKTKENGFVIGCMRYPDCASRAFFPSFVLDAQATQMVYSRCLPRESRPLLLPGIIVSGATCFFGFVIWFTTVANGYSILERVCIGHFGCVAEK